MTQLEKRMVRLVDGIASSLGKLAKDVSFKSVHRLRTTIRRTESLVTFAHPDLGRKQQKAMETLAALRKRAGKVRDLDVQIDLVGAIGNGSTAGDRKVLTDLLKTKRAKQAERLWSLIAKIKGAKLFSQLDRIAEEVRAPQLPFETTAVPLERAIHQLSEVAAEYGAHRSQSPSLLHQARIKLKMIRYLAELGEESTEQQRFLEELKRVQDALGAWHDWEELFKTAEKHFGERLNCPLLLEVRALLAARYAAAGAAVVALFSKQTTVPAQKPPQPTVLVETLAKRA
jgi:CHAD domain-containing protein